MVTSCSHCSQTHFPRTMKRLDFLPKLGPDLMRPQARLASTYWIWWVSEPRPVGIVEADVVLVSLCPLNLLPPLDLVHPLELAGEPQQEKEYDPCYEQRFIHLAAPASEVSR